MLKQLIIITTLFFSYNAFSLSWIGCGITKKGFIKKLSKKFEDKYGESIDIAGGGATKGLRYTHKNWSEIGGSCRHKQADGKTINQKESNVLLFPVAWDALVIIVNENNPISSLTTAQIKGIFSGKIHNWKEVGGQDAAIELVVRKGKLSGVGMMFRLLFFDNPDLNYHNPARSYPSTGPLEKDIHNSLNAIAVDGYTSAKVSKVKMIKIDGKAPTFTNIKAGIYPYFRPLYLVVNKNRVKEKKIASFLEYVQSSEAQQILINDKVIPYRDAIHLKDKFIQRVGELPDVKW